MTPTQEAIVRVRADLACGTALISNTESARDLRLILTAAEEAERLRSALRELVDAKAAWDATRMPGGGLRETCPVCRQIAEYNRRKPLAWDAARALTAAPALTRGLVEDSTRPPPKWCCKCEMKDCPYCNPAQGREGMSELSAPLPCPFCGSSYIESIMPGRWACDVCGASAKRWNNRAAPPAVGGEPVAWWRTREDGETLGIFYGAHPPKWGARSEWTPLYAAPRESPIPIDGERWNGMARAMQRIGAAGTEEEIEKQLRDAYSDSSASPEDEIRPWRWHSSMDDVVPETGQRAENVPVRSPDKGGAAGNGVAAGAERHVVHPAALPLEAAPPRPTVETTSPTSPGDTSSSGGSGAPSALDVAALARGLRARNLTVNDLAAAALEREHARAESWRLRADHEYARGAAIEAKIAALEAALRAADEMHKQGQRHYHGEPEHRTCPMCAAMDAYRAARDAP